MLEFKKEILTKVSFDLVLFEKELRKAVKWVSPTEVKELRSWCYRKFGQRYTFIFEKVF